MNGILRASAVGALLLSAFIVPSCSAQSASQPSRSRAPNGGSGSSAADWPGFRGPQGMGISAATDVPLAWSINQNVAWKTPLPGPGASSPIVWGDRIFVTCFSGYDPDRSTGSLEELQRHLICLRREDGQIEWDQTVKAKLPEERKIRDHGYAANTPTVDEQRVYAFFGKSGVAAFDHSGNPLWQADVGASSSGWGTAASPLLHRELLIINASVESESLIALDRHTGQEKWRAPGIRESWNTPLVVNTAEGKQELVVAIQGKVLAFDPDSGESLWSCDTDISWYMVPSVVAAEGIVYVLGGRSGTAALAVRAGGTGDVTRTHRLWTSKHGSNVTSPVYHEGHLYWMHEQLGIAYCARADSGEIVYEQRMNRAGQVYASSVLAGGRIYHLTRTGRMFVVAAKPEFDLLSTNDLDDGSLFNGSPAVTGNRLLLRSDKYLYCLGL
jgi:outer membrane protein assembly factor BamB